MVAGHRHQSQTGGDIFGHGDCAAGAAGPDRVRDRDGVSGRILSLGKIAGVHFGDAERGSLSAGGYGIGEVSDGGTTAGIVVQQNIVVTGVRAIAGVAAS